MSNNKSDKNAANENMSGSNLKRSFDPVIYDPSTLYSSIEKRADFLDALIKRKTADTEHGPKGYLKVSKKGNIFQYYIVEKASGKKKYISNTNISDIIAYSQNEYDRRLLIKAKKELSALSRLLKSVDHSARNYLKSSFDLLHPSKQPFVKPVILSDEKYIQLWLSEKYTGNPIPFNHSAFTTNNGELVRSKSEKLIADLYLSCGIPYKYEYPIEIREKKYYFDFALLKIKTREMFFHEHFGMLDDPVYAEKTVRKLKDYASVGIIPGKNLILTFESSNVPFDTISLKSLLKEYSIL